MDREIKDVEIKKATAEDIKFFYPEGSPRTCYAWIAFYRGMPACLAGVIMETGQYPVPFSDVLPNKAPKMTVYRTAIALFELIKSLKLPLFTGTEGCKSKFLESLGFVYIGERQGWEMYQCLQK